MMRTWLNHLAEVLRLPSRKPSSQRTARKRLSFDTLERRDLMAASLAATLSSDGLLQIEGTEGADRILVRQDNGQISVNGISVAYNGSPAAQINASLVQRIEVYGLGGDDVIRLDSGTESVTAPATLVGGAGRDTLVGGAGNDSLIGDSGDGTSGAADSILGGAGDDALFGDGGNDYLNGQAGNDTLRGGMGDDVLIAIDAATRDVNLGGAGRDIVWIDRNVTAAGRVYLDPFADASSADTVQRVTRFANGADRTLDGDALADPTASRYHNFAGNPLFSSSGPQASDIRQGSLGDCWLLAGLGAIASDNPFALRQNIVDFADGTFGVRLGNNFYRVDSDLPATSSSSSSSYLFARTVYAPVYARLGAEDSMWVAIAEKAYVHYRYGANDYQYLSGGWSVEVNRAFRTAAAGDRAIRSYASANALANDLYNRWSNHAAVTVGFAGGSVATGAPLINYHMYTVVSVTRNSAGVVTAIRLRNPWGYDGVGSDDNTSDGLVTVTPAQLYASVGRINWGRV